MKSEIFNKIKDVPATSGIFNLLDEKGRSLLLGVAENRKIEIKKIVSANLRLKTKTVSVVIYHSAEENLVRDFAEAARREKPPGALSLNRQNIYPHFKLTNEEFPRILATRRIEDDGAEYWGAFLPKTRARFTLGFLVDTFRLRGCDIPIDGNQPVPCPQFYRKKCVAPCVRRLCSKDEYAESVSLARLFLDDRRAELGEILQKEIAELSDELRFEEAAARRDLLRSIENVWNDGELFGAPFESVDTFSVEKRDSGVLINLVSQKGRKNLGKLTFFYGDEIDLPKREILSQLLWQLYQFYAPAKISVPVDFSSRRFLEKVLSRREKREIKISVVGKSSRKVSVSRALKRVEFEYEFDNLKSPPTVEEFQIDLQKEFSLPNNIRRIEAFDVAHISGSDFVGAKSVWENGKFLTGEYEFWFSDKKNELESLSETVKRRFEKSGKLPDLILIDGGKAQLRKVLENVDFLKNARISVISAVKPPGKHNEISHFLMAENRAVEFQKGSDVFNVLLRLRDEAHSLANYIHRSKRETAHFYEVFHALPQLDEKERYYLLRKFRSLKAARDAPESGLIGIFGETKGTDVFRRLKQVEEAKNPFIVPIRYDEANGEAADLQPLRAPKSY